MSAGWVDRWSRGSGVGCHSCLDMMQSKGAGVDTLIGGVLQEVALTSVCILSISVSQQASQSVHQSARWRCPSRWLQSTRRVCVRGCRLAAKHETAERPLRDQTTCRSWLEQEMAIQSSRSRKGKICFACCRPTSSRKVRCGCVRASKPLQRCACEHLKSPCSDAASGCSGV